MYLLPAKQQHAAAAAAAGGAAAGGATAAAGGGWCFQSPPALKAGRDCTHWLSSACF
jgi:hypothetical protein